MSEPDYLKNPQDWNVEEKPSGNEFDNADVGALAHLYRGEVYRSTIWRQRLDMTTNWAVVTLGIALSISYASPEASPLPLLIVGLLAALFLVLEARRYRYFNVWRARARWIETNFYAPMLSQSRRPEPGAWQDILANDYLHPNYHIGYMRSLGRRIRRNYMWIFIFQAIAYYGKIIIHPTPLTSMAEFFERMAVGPIAGYVIFLLGFVFHGAWVTIGIVMYVRDRAKHRAEHGVGGMG